MIRVLKRVAAFARPSILVSLTLPEGEDGPSRAPLFLVESTGLQVMMRGPSLGGFLRVVDVNRLGACSLTAKGRDSP